MNFNIKGVGEEESSMMGPGKMWLDRWRGGGGESGQAGVIEGKEENILRRSDELI